MFVLVLMAFCSSACVFFVEFLLFNFHNRWSVLAVLCKMCNIFRDFQYSKDKINQQQNEVTNLQKAKIKAYVPLIRWLKGNFSEAFVNWIHVKALRLFTESVLRYGLPATFMVCGTFSFTVVLSRAKYLYGNGFSIWISDYDF